MQQGALQKRNRGTEGNMLVSIEAATVSGLHGARVGSSWRASNNHTGLLAFGGVLNMAEICLKAVCRQRS